MEFLAVVADFQVLIARTAAEAAAAGRTRIPRHSVNGLWGGKFELNPGLLSHRRGRQQRGLGIVAIGKRGQSEIAAARSNLGLQFGERLIGAGKTKGDDRRIGIPGAIAARLFGALGIAGAGDILERARNAGRLGQSAGEGLPAFHAGFRPHELLHVLRCWLKKKTVSSRL
jgi:hypothetical protein